LSVSGAFVPACVSLLYARLMSNLTYILFVILLLVWRCN
jgi:hypothetical protein